MSAIQKKIKGILSIAITLYSLSLAHAIDIEDFITNDKPESGNQHVLTLDLSEPLCTTEEGEEKRIESTQFLLHFKGLVNLNLYGCIKINTLRYVSTLQNLQELDISFCFNTLYSLHHLANLLKLRILKMEHIYTEEAFEPHNRDNLPSIDWAESITSLEKLFLGGNYYLKKIEPVTRLPNLQEVDITACDALIDRDLLRNSSISAIKGL